MTVAHEAELVEMWRDLRREVRRRCAGWSAEVRHDAAMDQFLVVLEKSRRLESPPHGAAARYAARNAYRTLTHPNPTGTGFHARPRATPALGRGEDGPRPPDEWIAETLRCEDDATRPDFRLAAVWADCRRRRVQAWLDACRGKAPLHRRARGRSSARHQEHDADVQAALARLQTAEAADRRRVADATGQPTSTVAKWCRGAWRVPDRLRPALLAAAADVGRSAADQGRALAMLRAAPRCALARTIGCSPQSAWRWRAGARPIPRQWAIKLLEVGEAGGWLDGAGAIGRLIAAAQALPRLAHGDVHWAADAAVEREFLAALAECEATGWTATEACERAGVSATAALHRRRGAGAAEAPTLDAAGAAL